MSKRRLIYGSVRSFEAGSVISQKPRICGLGLDFCFYPQTNQRGRSTARVCVRRWALFFLLALSRSLSLSLSLPSLFKPVRPGGPWIFHGLPRILRIIKQWIFAFNRVHKSNALADTMRCFSSNNHSPVAGTLFIANPPSCGTPSVAGLVSSSYARSVRSRNRGRRSCANRLGDDYLRKGRNRCR